MEVLKKEKDLKSQVDKLQKKVQELEVGCFEKEEKIQTLTEELSKSKELSLKYRETNSNYKKAIDEIQEEVKQHRKKYRDERDNLEKILLKSDKVVSFLYNATVTLAKSVGKVLHNLLLNIDYDMKDILSKIFIEDVSKVHEWILFFEKNEFLKKHRIFRNMGDKLGFYKKLEIPLLQDAYGRISKTLKQGDKLADRGEFSGLNSSQVTMFNKSRISFNKSMVSVRDKSLQEEGGFGGNILDELNVDSQIICSRKENTSEFLAMVLQSLESDVFQNISLTTISDIVRKTQLVAEKVQAGIQSLTLDTKNVSSHEGGDGNKGSNVASAAAVNIELYNECSVEIQEGLKSLEIKISMIERALKSRNLFNESNASNKILEIITQNHLLNEEDFKMNTDDLDNPSLITLLENSFLEKQKLFESKRLFIRQIRQIRENLEGRLGALYDNLNHVEDEYILSERMINKLKESISQVNRNIEEITNKKLLQENERINLAMRLESKELSLKELEEEVTKSKETTELMDSQLIELNEKIIGLMSDVQNSQQSQFETEMKLVEMQEKSLCLDQLMSEVNVEMKSNNELLKIKEMEVIEKKEQLTKIVVTHNLEEMNLQKAERLLRILEGKEEPSILLSEGTKKTLNNIITELSTNDKIESTNVLIEDIKSLIGRKDPAFLNLLKFTITSQLKTEDKVIKIIEIFSDRVGKTALLFSNLQKSLVFQNIRDFSVFLLKLAVKDIKQLEENVEVVLAALKSHVPVNESGIESGLTELSNIMTIDSQFRALIS